MSTGPLGGQVLLRGREIVKYFDGNRVLDGVDLDLLKGECVVLEGENGSGKTTLLNILSGILLPDAGALEFRINGFAATYRFPLPLRSRWNPFSGFHLEAVASAGLGRGWQDVRLFRTESLEDNLRVAVREQVGESPLRALIKPGEVHRQEASISGAAREMLAAFGLRGRERSSADKVSYGQAKRVAILRALLGGAKVLLLDEPLAGLDHEGIEEMMGFLRRVSREEGVTTVVVEHHLHLGRLMGLATSVWRLENGRLRVSSSLERASGLSLESPPVGQVPELLRAMEKPGDQVRQCELPGGAVVTTLLRPDLGENDTLLELDALTVNRGPRAVIGAWGIGSEGSLFLRLRRGEMAILQAPNGWGKTTLLECIAGMLPPTGGRILLCGRPVQGLPTWKRRQSGIAILRSRAQCFPNLSVPDFMGLMGMWNEDCRPFGNRKVSTLSAGERQQLRLATLLASRGAWVYLLDEPFGALDAAALSKVRDSLSQLLDHGAALIAVPSA